MALNIDDVFVAVEQRLHPLIGVLHADKEIGRLPADDVVSEEIDAGPVGPGIDLVFVHLHDDVRYGLQDGFVACEGGNGMSLASFFHLYRLV
jgi:hypothetical protein